MERKEKNLKKSKVKSTGFIYLSSFMEHSKLRELDYTYPA